MQKSRLTLNGLLVLAATIAFQSCDPTITEPTPASDTRTSGCAIAIRASRSACANPGGAIVSQPAPAATRNFQISVGVADSSRLPDSVHVFGNGQVAASPTLAAKGANSFWTLVVAATFDQPVQVPDTVFVQAFRKSNRIATIKCLNLSLSSNAIGDWSVVAIDRDSSDAKLNRL